MKRSIKEFFEKGPGIRGRLWFAMMGVTIAVVLVVYLGQIVLLRTYFEVGKKADVSKIAEEIEIFIRDGEVPIYGNVISKYAYDNSFCIEISDLTGTNLKTADMMGSGCVIHNINQRTLSGIKTELISEPDKAHYYNIKHPLYQKESILFGKAITVGDSLCLLLINAYLEPIDGTTEILKTQLLGTTMFALMLSTIISFVVSQTFTRPIRKLKSAASEVALGNLDVKVDVEREDELGDLANTFNYMTDEVSKVGALQKDLVANVSHEMRIPLTMIRGYAEAIKDITGEDKEKRDKQLDIIIEETDRLNDLVGDILSLGRLEAGHEKIEEEEIPVKELIEGILQKYKMIYPDYSFGLSCNWEGVVLADAGRITQVIMNLINNAINHTGDDNIVEIGLADEGDLVKVSVADTGKGIEKEDLKFIWDRYYKSNKSGKRRVAGTGLGLSIVKAIMIAHKMPFGVDSKPNEGSIFWICLKKK